MTQRPWAPARALVLVLTAILLCFGGVAGAEGVGGIITGRVIDQVTGTPLSGATVSISGGGMPSTTDAYGTYTLTGVPTGGATITVSLPGFNTASSPITVDGSTQSVNVGLKIAGLDALDLAQGTDWLLTGDLVVNQNVYLEGGTLDLNGHRLTIKGHLIQQGGVVVVGTGTLEVAGDYRIQYPHRTADGIVSLAASDGYLVMQNQAGLVSVQGSFVTQSNQDEYNWSHSWLDSGTMEVGGDFRQIAGEANNFHTTGSGSFTLRLTGSGPQQLSFDRPDTSMLDQVIIANQNMITFLPELNARHLASASGIPLRVTTGSLAGSVSLTLVQDMEVFPADAASAVVQMTGGGIATATHTLTLHGSLHQSGGTLSTDGGGQALIGGSLYQSGGVVTVGAGQIHVGGDYRIQSWSAGTGGALTFGESNGYLMMQNEGGLLTVQGTFATQSVQDEYDWGRSWLDSGTMEVGGDFQQIGGNGCNFCTTGSGKLTLRLAGTGPQTVSFANPGTSVLDQVSIANRELITFVPEINSRRLATENGIPLKVTTGTLSGLTGLTLAQDLEVFPPDSAGGIIGITGHGVDTAGHILTVHGNLYQSDGSLHVDAGQVLVNGDYRIQSWTAGSTGESGFGESSGSLYMQSAEGLLTVTGSFVTQSVQDEYNWGRSWLDSGTMEVRGDFRQIAGNAYNFMTTESGTFKLRLTGARPQQVSFATPGYSVPNQVVIANPNMITFTPEINTRKLISENNIPLKVTTGTLAAYTSLTLAQDLEVIPPDSAGGIVGISAVSSQSVDTAGHTLLIRGKLYQSAGTLTVGAGRVLVDGDYRIQSWSSLAGGVTFGESSGILLMQDSAGLARVGGTFATQSNQDHLNWGHDWLSAGTLEVGGDFLQIAGSGYNFGASGSGSHRVRLIGSGPQLVAFANPGASVLNEVVIANKSVITFSPEINARRLVTADQSPAAVVTGKLAEMTDLVLAQDLDVTPPAGQDFVLQSDHTVSLNRHRLHVHSSLIQSGGTLVPGGGMLVTDGDYRLQTRTLAGGTPVFGESSSLLLMQDPAGLIQVRGSFVTQSNLDYINWGHNWLSSGTLEVWGDFTQINGSPYNFATVPGSSYKVRLAGTGAQRLTFSDATASGIETLELANCTVQPTIQQIYRRLTDGCADAPAVSATYPTAGAAGADPHGPILLAFTRPLRSLAVEQLILTGPDGSAVPVQVTLDGEWARIVPVSPLAPGAAYRLDVPANAALDAGDSPMTGAFTLSFSTSGEPVLAAMTYTPITAQHLSGVAARGSTDLMTVARSLAARSGAGTLTAFSALQPVNWAPRLTVVAASSCQGGFGPGEALLGGEAPGTIIRISADGAQVADPWVALPGETGMVRGLTQDSACNFGGDLVAVTDSGRAWRVTSAGAATLLGTVDGAVPLESVVTTPAAGGAPWSGMALAAAADGTVYGLDGVNPAMSWNFTSGATDLEVISSGLNLYAYAPDLEGFMMLPAARFTGMDGDLLVVRSRPGEVWRVHWVAADEHAETTLLSAAEWLGDTTFSAMSASPAGGTVAGLVTAEYQADASGIQIQLAGNGVSYSGAAAADGSFAIAGVPDGQYVLTAGRSSHLSMQVSVTVSSGRVTVPAAGIQLTLPFGDLNGNGRIDVTDLGLLEAQYLVQGSDTNPVFANLDLTRDGLIDIYDLVPLGRNIQ